MKMNLKLTADELMDVVDAAVDAARERNYMIPEEELIEDMTYIVDAALSAMGIEVVEDAEDAEETEVDDFGVPVDYDDHYEYSPCDDCYHPKACEMCDFNVKDEEADPIEKMLFIHEGKVTISEKNAMEIVRQMTEMIEERGKGLSNTQKTKWLRDALTALAKDYGIEYVLDV